MHFYSVLVSAAVKIIRLVSRSDARTDTLLSGTDVARGGSEIKADALLNCCFRNEQDKITIFELALLPMQVLSQALKRAINGDDLPHLKMHSELTIAVNQEYP